MGVAVAVAVGVGVGDTWPGATLVPGVMPWSISVPPSRLSRASDTPWTCAISVDPATMPLRYNSARIVAA